MRGSTGWPLVAALLGGRRPGAAPDGATWHRATPVRRALAYLPVVLLLAAAAWLQSTRTLPAALAAWGALLTILFLLGRQFVTVELNAALTRQLRQQSGELARQASHDTLTGTGNRALLDRRMRNRLEDPRRTGSDAVLLVDLDRFKTINDTYGHAAGDAVLVAVAGRLRSAASGLGTVARLGGDEFVVLLEDVTEAAAVAVAEDILTRLRGPVAVLGVTLHVRASVGLVLVPAGGGADPHTLIQEADLALHEARAAGRDCARVFVPGTQGDVADRIQLDRELRDALDADQFRLFYQPIVTLDGPGRITGVEALLRWEHPRRGLLTPPYFLDRAEALTLMPALTRWTLREACRQAARWGTTVNVNISASQVLDPALVEHVAGALATSGLPPDRLTLEITEHAILADVAAVAARLAEVKRLGVRLALDDFGTGYSSLTHLNALAIDVIKIDKSFVDQVADPASPAVTEALLQIAGTLGLTAVAEGVERLDQADRLTALGCGHAQGYYFARPMAADAFTALLAEPCGRIAAMPAVA